MTTPLAAKIAREYGTPVAVIDMDRVERNIARIQATCDAAGVANRPHIKTHKSPVLAKKQIEAGAKGITCQKLGEAEVMADAGIDDILIYFWIKHLRFDRNQHQRRRPGFYNFIHRWIERGEVIAAMSRIHIKIFLNKKTNQFGMERANLRDAIVPHRVRRQSPLA